MTIANPRVVEYLARLETELEGLPIEMRNEIVAGVQEELSALSPADAAVRMQELGDPAFIATEARAEALEQRPLDATPAPGRGSSIAAVIMLIAGSIVVPGIGALAGLVWLTTAPAWTRREKAIAWLIPVAAALAVSVAIVALMSAQAAGAHVAVLIGYLVFPVEGVVLAIRGQRRGWRAQS